MFSAHVCVMHVVTDNELKEARSIRERTKKNSSSKTVGAL